jgi:hypothetical protein
VRERRAVIELVEENAQLRECYADSSIDSVTPDSNRVASLKRHYDTLLSSLIADHKAYLTRIRLQRDATTVKAQDLISRCARLETSVAEGTRELLRERGEKHALQVRVEEMQTSIEQRITSLRRHLDHSGRGISDNTETTRLKQENEQLRMNMEQFKVHLKSIIDTESSGNTVFSRTRSNINPRTRTPSSKTKVIILQVTNTRDHGSSLDVNPAFRDRIKQIERLALRYAPFQGPEVDHLFSEIEYAKDVLDGRKPPPKLKRVKSKRKKV